MEHDGRAAPARGKIQGHRPGPALRRRRALRLRAGQVGLVSTRDRADRAPSFLTLRCKISRPGVSGSASAASPPLPLARENGGASRALSPGAGLPGRRNRLAKASVAGAAPNSPGERQEGGPG